MAADPNLIAALEASVAADSSNTALRGHLAQLLAEAGRHAEALGHAAQVLQIAPDDAVALQVLTTSTAALRPPSPTTQSAPDPDDSLAAAVPDTADELLDQWLDSDALVEVGVDAPGRPGVSFDDIGGMEQVKLRLRVSFLDPLRNPDIAAQFGKRLRGGLMLWGPPGCGKTFMAKALAGELGASFYVVGLNDVLEMWIGKSEQNLHAIFETARANRPCVLFFDEIDAIGQKRTNLRGSGATFRNVVNLFLSELDGAGTDNDGVFVLAATNHPWDVDPALLRPGRFDRSILVLPPDAPARDAILRLHLRGRPVEPIDIGRIVTATDGYSGADLALVCEHATERAMEASIRQGTVRPISQGDLADAVRSVRPSNGAWFETARNFATYSNDDGTYDELIAYLSKKRR